MVDYEEVRAYAAAQMLLAIYSTEQYPAKAATKAVQWADELIDELKRTEAKKGSK